MQCWKCPGCVNLAEKGMGVMSSLYQVRVPVPVIYGVLIVPTPVPV